MQKEEIYQGLVKVLEQEFDVPADSVSLETNLYQDLDIDSIDAIDLLIQLKKLTGKQLAPEVFRQVKTIGDVVDAVYKHINTDPS